MTSNWGNLTSGRASATSPQKQLKRFERTVPTPAGTLSVTLKESSNSFELTAIIQGQCLRGFIESFDEPLAQALFDYLSAGTKFLSPGTATIFGNPNIYGHFSAGLTNFLKSSATYREKAVAVLIGQRLEFSEKQLQEMVESHCLLFPGAPTEATAVQYFLPSYSSFTADEALTLKRLVCSMRDYQIFTTAEGLQLARAGLAVENLIKRENADGPVMTTKMADWDYFIDTEGKLYFTRFTKLPLHTKRFREYVLGLRGDEFRKLIGQVPGSSSADAAIEFSEKLLRKNDHNKVDILVEVTQHFGEIAPILARYEDPYLLTNAFTLFMGVYQTPARAMLMASYLKTVDSVNLMDSHRLNLVLNGLINSKWVKPANMADLVIEKLLAVGTPAEVAKVLADTALEGKSLTVKQWEVFAENFDVYKDLAVGWWLPLVKRVSGD